MAALVDPALDVLAAVLRRKDGKLPDRHALRAARDVLYRGGYTPKHRVVLSGDSNAPPVSIDLSRLSDEQLEALEIITRAAQNKDGNA